MRRASGAGFVVPFVLGTVLGAVGGATLGTLLGRQIATSVLHLWSLITRHDDEELRFDLLLQ